MKRVFGGKTGQRILMAVLTVALLLPGVVSPMPVQAAEGYQSAGSVHWTYSGGILSFECAPGMGYTQYVFAPQRDYSSIGFDSADVTTIYFGKGCSPSALGFTGYKNLQNVLLPSDIVILDLSAFRSCPKLEKIDIPANVSVVVFDPDIKWTSNHLTLNYLGTRAQWEELMEWSRTKYTSNPSDEELANTEFLHYGAHITITCSDDKKVDAGDDPDDHSGKDPAEDPGNDPSADKPILGVSWISGRYDPEQKGIYMFWNDDNYTLDPEAYAVDGFVVYRKDESNIWEEIACETFNDLTNLDLKMNYLDTDVEYGKAYTYSVAFTYQGKIGEWGLVTTKIAAVNVAQIEDPNQHSPNQGDYSNRPDSEVQRQLREQMKENGQQRKEQKQNLQKARTAVSGYGKIVTLDYTLHNYISDKQFQTVEKALNVWTAMMLNEDRFDDTSYDEIYKKLLTKMSINPVSVLFGHGMGGVFCCQVETPKYGMLTILFNLEMNGYHFGSSKDFAVFGTLDYIVRADDPAVDGKTGIGVIASSDPQGFTDQVYEIAEAAIKDAYKEVWGNDANQVAEMLLDKTLLAIVNDRCGSVSNGIFQLLLKPAKSTAKQIRAQSVDGGTFSLLLSGADGTVTRIDSDWSGSSAGKSLPDGVSVQVVNGEIVVNLPEEEYEVALLSEEDTVISYRIREYGDDALIREVTFEDVALEPDTALVGYVPSHYLLDAAVYALGDESGSVILSDSDEREWEDPQLPEDWDEEPEPSKGSGFTDVPANAWYADAVAWAVMEGITTGTSDTTFSPDRTCTRAQLVTFLWRAAGEPQPMDEDPGFVDVGDEYYTPAVAWAVEEGITTGVGNGRFGPNQTCTRAQVVTFLHRYAGEPWADETANFADVPGNAWYSDAVDWAVEEGITQGTGSGKFSPSAGCTRAQIVTFLYRFME